MNAPNASARCWRIGFLCLAVTALGWGLNWPIIKLLLREWPPLFARGCAGIAAALGLALLAIARGETLAVPRGARVPLVLAAAINVFAWMGLGTVALVWLSVAEGTLLIYTMPIWAMLLAWPVLGERPAGRSIAALALGCAGVSVLLWGSGLQFGPGKLPGIGLALAAAILFAYGTLRGRSPLPLPPLALTAWQVGLGCAPMVVLGALFENPDLEALSAVGWASLIYMAVVPMGVCYLGWFEAARRLPGPVASTGMLMVPVIGVLSAAPIIGERLGLREVAALSLTLAGVGLALWRPADTQGPEREDGA